MGKRDLDGVNPYYAVPVADLVGEILMEEGRGVREEVKWWIEVARKNLRRAETAFERSDYEAAAFWSQQVVEFALKALVLFKGMLPPKTHNLVELYELVRGLIGDFEEELLSELTPYYSISRYPDIFPGVPVVHRNTALRFIRFSRELFRKACEAVGLET